MSMSLSIEDGMIAAICPTNRATLSMRNGKACVGLDIDLVDTWSDER